MNTQESGTAETCSAECHVPHLLPMPTAIMQSWTDIVELKFPLPDEGDSCDAGNSTSGYSAKTPINARMVPQKVVFDREGSILRRAESALRNGLARLPANAAPPPAPGLPGILGCIPPTLGKISGEGAHTRFCFEIQSFFVPRCPIGKAPCHHGTLRDRDRPGKMDRRPGPGGQMGTESINIGNRDATRAFAAVLLLSFAHVGPSSLRLICLLTRHVAIVHVNSPEVQRTASSWHAV
jgi:hypothetical protein